MLGAGVVVGEEKVLGVSVHIKENGPPMIMILLPFFIRGI